MDISKIILDIDGVRKLSDVPLVSGYISSGCLPLDIILSGRIDGGFPYGRIIEIFGDTSTGKTLLAIQACVEAQLLGAFVAYADTESALNDRWMQSLGVNIDDVARFVPSTISELFSVLSSLIKSKNENLGEDHPMLFVWDSVASTGTTAEIQAIEKNELEKPSYAAQAIQISKSLRNMIGFLSKSNVTCIFINQVRSNIGVLYGSKITTFGGKAIPFYASVRLYLKTRSVINDDNGLPIGVIMNAYVSKNKIHTPFKSLDIPIFFDSGTHDVGPMLDVLLMHGLVTKNSSWYSITLSNGNAVKFQRNKFEAILEDNSNEILDSLESKLNG